MARPNHILIQGIKNAADKINNEKNYQWGHMGACNCGYLAQELTLLTKGEIHRYAMEGHGDWSEQVNAFCPTSKLPMDLMISEMIAAGLSLEDLINLERLADKEVLSTISVKQREQLRYNAAQDVALYMRYWAQLLEKNLTVHHKAHLTVR